MTSIVSTQLDPFVALAFTSLGNLASSATKLVGASSALLDLTTIPAGFLDVYFSAKIIGPAGAPTTNTGIELFMYTPIDDGVAAASFPTVTAGTMGADGNGVTFQSDEQKRGQMIQIPRSVIVVNITAGVHYNGKPFSLARLFSGQAIGAKKVGFFCTHNLGQPLPNPFAGVFGYRAARQVIT